MRRALFPVARSGTAAANDGDEWPSEATGAIPGYYRHARTGAGLWMSKRLRNDAAIR